MKNKIKKIICLMLVLSTVLFLSACKEKPIDLNKISETLSTYNIDMVYEDETHTLSCEQTFEYKNDTDTIVNELMFHIYPRAFEEGAMKKPVSELNEANAYPNGKSYGKFTIEEVVVGDKADEYMITGSDSDILKVGVGELKPNQKTTVEMKYEMVLPNINHRYGYGDNTVNLSNFYPVLCVYENGEYDMDGYHSNGDPFYSKVANYNISLTCDTDFVVANSGYVTNETANNELKTIEMKAQVVRDFSIVLSKKFSVITGTVGKTKVSYYYYDQMDSDVYLTTALDSVRTFNETFGEYPYTTLSVVRSNFVHGGMEYPNLVLISDQVTDKVDYNNVIIHEIAHQWWYGVVGNDEFQYGWLDEGLTEYSTALFYEKNPAYGINMDDIVKNTNNSYVSFLELYESVLGELDTTMNRRLDDYVTEYEYVYMAYVKGMLLFDNIRDVVGDNKFFGSLQLYYKDNMFSLVSPSNLIGAFEKKCGRGIGQVFSSWIDGKVVVRSMS